MVCTDSPTVPLISSGWYSGITFKLPCQSSTYVAIKNKKQVVSLGEIKVSIQFRAQNIYYVHHIWSSNCKKDWTLSLKTESSACQLWWGSLFKSCDHIQIPLYQRASWCHLWPNNVKQHSFFGRCQTATSSSRHVGWVTLLWTSHWAEQRASLKKKQTWIEKPQLLFFFCLFFSSIWNFSCILLELATWDADSSARYSRRTGESSASSSLALCYRPQGLQYKPSIASTAKGFESVAT